MTKLTVILLASSHDTYNAILLYARDPEQVAMDKLVELAYKKLLVSFKFLMLSVV